MMVHDRRTAGGDGRGGGDGDGQSAIWGKEREEGREGGEIPERNARCVTAARARG